MDHTDTISPRLRPPSSRAVHPPLSAALSQKTRTVRKARKNLTREERAQIRWMNARGFSYSKIADIHDISVSTVRNAVENVIYSRPDNASEDDQYLDAEFLAKYLPEVEASSAATGPSHASDPKVSTGNGASSGSGFDASSLGSVKSVKLTLSGEGANNGSGGRASLGRSPRRANPYTRRSVSTGVSRGVGPEPQSISASASAPMPRNGRLAEADANGPSSQLSRITTSFSIPDTQSPASRSPSMADTMASSPHVAMPSERSAGSPPNASPAPRATPRPLDPENVVFFRDFLSNLDVDLTRFQTDLIANNLGCARHVLPLRSWTSHELYDLLKEAIPGMSPLERYVLVQGMRAMDDNGRKNPSTIRRLREDPSANAQLQSRVDANRFLNLIGFGFETQNLDTMYKIILISSWPPEVIHAFIVEDIPEIPPVSRYVLVHGLRTLWTHLQEVGEWTAPSNSELLPVRTPPRYLSTFLAALDYDMSEYEGFLVERGLDSLHIITAVRRWPAGDLHAMLRDVYPDLPVVKRYVLVHGIRACRDDGVYEKSARRVALDASPDAWARPAFAFLASLAHDLSGYLATLAKVNLGTLGQLAALSDWDGDELHGLLKEAVPELSVTHRFILVKGVKGIPLNAVYIIPIRDASYENESGIFGQIIRWPASADSTDGHHVVHFIR
ncbi:uncharacterized protein SCHCODRAFT_02666150 [Schizophyllum commune H4-8]|uniref:Uncharacterized protein n=1 Tax=Schizophyllum commune (strain H4-8 / FGSC 9210) TaxID=578458 RepID=D8QM88_SCHCM|nr:uncharacterized protein SCHCODRAFT_02666150 [Schizophyllum commune H4-8]KAI5892967.1 hypothetical protein SCHCODRAFT_02666150 [Schizophyllum commune H4-8]